MSGCHRDTTLADLGLHRLKDLGRPERVFEVRHPEIPARDAPLRSLDNLPNNLPVQLTSFVGPHGRARRAARPLLPSTRLLSITGAGGCGKTRLAVQLAADVLDALPGRHLARRARDASPIPIASPRRSRPPSANAS